MKNGTACRQPFYPFGGRRLVTRIAVWNSNKGSCNVHLTRRYENPSADVVYLPLYYPSCVSISQFLLLNPPDLLVCFVA